MSLTQRTTFRPRCRKATFCREQQPLTASREARLMALAIVIDEMVRAGDTTYAEVARTAGVSRARVSQVMQMLDHSPAVQGNLVAGPTLRGSPSLASYRSES